jgi:hypothetical protein
MTSSLLVVWVMTAVSVIVVALAAAQVRRAAAEGAFAPSAGERNPRKARQTRASAARTASLAVVEQPARRVDEQPMRSRDAIPVATGSDDDEAEIPEPLTLDGDKRRSALIRAFGPSKRKDVENKTAEPAAYADLGTEVAAILTAAERSSAEIRAKSSCYAERTTSDANEYASAVRAEADAVRADAERYGDAQRANVDVYAGDARRQAEDAAARTISEAEERAWLIVMDAEHNAAKLEAEGRRRREELSIASDGAELRIKSMLVTFGTLTGELEALLPDERVSVPNG